MKKFTKKTICAALLLGTALTFAQQTGDSFADAKNSKSANLVYIHAGVNGFASNNGGSTTGLLVDVMREFENFVNEKYGITISSKYVEAQNRDFKLYLQEVRSSSAGVFGLSNTSVKEERKKFLKYSPTFLNNISVLISHRSFPTLTQIGNISSAFNGKVGFGVPSTTNYDRMIAVKSGNFPSMQITDVTSSRDILENISSNQNAFGFSDIHYYLEYLELGKPVKRHPVGDQVGDEFGIIMPLSNDWEEVMAEFLGAFVKTGKYRELVTRNLGKGALRMIAN